jgi:hypothetical protein
MNFTDVALNTVFPDSPAESALTRSGLASLGLHSGHSFGYGRPRHGARNGGCGSGRKRPRHDDGRRGRYGPSRTHAARHRVGAAGIVSTMATTSNAASARETRPGAIDLPVTGH